MIIFEIILGIIIAIGFYNLIHHFFVIIPNRKNQLIIKHRTDGAVQSILCVMSHNRWLTTSKVIINSSLLSQVWGRNIFAYDYKLALSFNSYQQLSRFKHEFQNLLTKYCFDHQLLIRGHNLLSIADVWSYNKHTHLDIAYRINSSTVDYLRDLKKCR